VRNSTYLPREIKGTTDRDARVVELDKWLKQQRIALVNFDHSDSLIAWLDHCSPHCQYPQNIENMRGACLRGTNKIVGDFFLMKSQPLITLSKLKDRLFLLDGLISICTSRLSGMINKQ